MARLTTRDYKRSSRGSSALKLKEFGLGVLVGAVLASAGFLIAGAHARHRVAASHARSGADSQEAAPHAPAPDDPSSNSPDDDTSGSGSSRHSASAHAAAQAPQYDFYRMLPRFKVPVSRDDDHPSHAAPPPEVNDPQHAAGSAPSYMVQVGSYRSTAEADQVRARLARAGVSAQVQRIVEGTRTLNRVRIGPLSDAELARVREQLRTANIHALVIRADH
ncbi:MAG TPA: SPOR domain-containing protein [Steroidobacteraceae bacterium]|nr:SPOR domain-containing protein [Steroidobacteraceae bacterium]